MELSEKYAESKGRNAIHGSDSDENAIIESEFHFQPSEIVWYCKNIFDKIKAYQYW